MIHQLNRWCAAICFVLAVNTISLAQGDTPLYEREPFDRITLDAKNDNAVVEVFPMKSLRDGLPAKFAGNEFIIRLVDDAPDTKYAVDGKHIVKIERFNDLLLDEAKKAVRKRDVDTAFLFLARLKQEAPNTAGLNKIEEDFFFEDTRQLFVQKRYDESLLSIERVLRLNPNRKGLDRALNGILSQMVSLEFDAGNYESVRTKLEFAGRKYGGLTAPLVKQWNKRLKAKGVEQLAIAKQSYADGKSSAALVAIRRAAEIWPELEGMAELQSEILSEFTNVRVGVTQPYEPTTKSYTPSQMLNWATRRTEPLLYRDLLLLDDYTVDGAVYRSEFGELKTSTDMQRIELSLVPELSGQGHRITQQLLALANPNGNNNSPRWAEYVSTLYAKSARIECELTRPTLRPTALLPRALRSELIADLTEGQYKLYRNDGVRSQTFSRRNVEASTEGLNELTEEVFGDPTEACRALADGQLDVVDRIHAGDYDSLANNPAVKLIPYRLPTIHGLVFNDRLPILRDSTFRRGLLYGINRQEFVNRDLGSNKKKLARVLSGFAPIGRSNNDPLGYAYNPRVIPRNYDPSLGSVLLKLSLKAKQAKELQAIAKEEEATEETNTGDGSGDGSGGDESKANLQPKIQIEMPEITLAHPDSHIATIGSLAVAAGWQKIGLKVSLRPLPPGVSRPVDGDWDVLYIETMVEEPLVDLPELVLGHKILGRHGGLVWQSMRQLQDANSLEEVRTEFQRIHRLTFDHTPILPLWQIIEHAAVRNNFDGLSDDLIYLYQDVGRWRFQ